jgi:hypothetical protein
MAVAGVDARQPGAGDARTSLRGARRVVGGDRELGELLLVQVDRRVDLQAAVDQRRAVVGALRTQILGDLLLDEVEHVRVLADRVRVVGPRVQRLAVGGVGLRLGDVAGSDHRLQHLGPPVKRGPLVDERVVLRRSLAGRRATPTTNVGCQTRGEASARGEPPAGRRHRAAARRWLFGTRRGVCASSTLSGSAKMILRVVVASVARQWVVDQLHRRGQGALGDPPLTASSRAEDPQWSTRRGNGGPRRGRRLPGCFGIASRRPGGPDGRRVNARLRSAATLRGRPGLAW